jgi:hypothetical protein
MVKDHMRCWCRRGTAVGVVTVERHVDEEVVDVGEEFHVGEDVLLMDIRNEEVVSSRACRALPKYLIASLQYRIARD